MQGGTSGAKGRSAKRRGGHGSAADAPHEGGPLGRRRRRHLQAFVREDHSDGLALVVDLERWPARDELVGEDARRPNVDLGRVRHDIALLELRECRGRLVEARARIDKDLGRHVVERACARACARPCALARPGAPHCDTRGRVSRARLRCCATAAVAQRSRRPRACPSCRTGRCGRPTAPARSTPRRNRLSSPACPTFPQASAPLSGHACMISALAGTASVDAAFGRDLQPAAPVTTRRRQHGNGRRALAKAAA